MSEKRDELTGKVLGCALQVSTVLGCGFLEKVYENALMVELAEQGLQAEQQKRLEVSYRGHTVGEYAADILVEDQVILELKAAKDIDEIHAAQLLNYLRAARMRRGLILNFGTPKLGIRRLVL